jgi:hypothetical protein
MVTECCNVQKGGFWRILREKAHWLDELICFDQILSLSEKLALLEENQHLKHIRK